jgi:cytosine/adenosine deaminase-related metal-dependent hydrolase
LVHCTFIDDKEIEILARTGTPVAHCPLANAITGNPRVTRVPEMNQAGVTVGLGTDSVATNDSLDLFQVMKTAAMIHRVHRGSIEVMTAEKLIEMSTIESAKALQLDDEVGSLEVGKKADVIVFKRDVPGLNPILNPIKNLVYSTGCKGSVDTVMVDGKILLDDGKVTTMDESQVYDRIEEIALELNSKLGRLDEHSMLNTSPWIFS